jgi:hypothetical protein
MEITAVPLCVSLHRLGTIRAMNMEIQVARYCNAKHDIPMAVLRKKEPKI